MPPLRDDGDNIRGEIADPQHVGEAAPTLAQPGSELRQRSGLGEHGLLQRISFGDQPNQPAVPVGRVRLGAGQDQFDDLATAHALDRETEVVDGIHLGDKGQQVQCNIDMVVMQIDALDDVLKYSTLVCGDSVAE